MRGQVCSSQALPRLLSNLTSRIFNDCGLLRSHIALGKRTLTAKSSWSFESQRSVCLTSRQNRLTWNSKEAYWSSLWTESRPGSCSTLCARPVRHQNYSSKPPAKDTFGEMTEEQYDESPNRFQLLPSKQIKEIFGPGITHAQGNELLATIQKQRVTGTLDVDINGPSVNKARVARALQWLREYYPLDEDAAIMARIEREEQVISTWHPQQGTENLNDLKQIYGHSQFEERIQQVKELNAQREKKAKEEQERIEAEGGQHNGPKELAQRGSTSVGRTRSGDSAEWVRKYRERAKLSDLNEVPDISPRQVLVRPTLAALAIIGLCVWFGKEYTPPQPQNRLFPEIPPAAATVGGIVALNALVFVMWRVPPFWRFLNRNFMLITATPRSAALVGNVFSHQGIGHLASNMLGLWFLGTQLCDEVGRGRFLALYLASGVFGSWVSLVRFVATRNYTYTTLGASGAVLGVIGAFCALYPGRYLTIAFLPPEWARTFAMRAEYVLYTGMAVTAALVLRGRIRDIDHAAHLGGMVAGVASAELIRRQARANRTAWAQVRTR